MAAFQQNERHLAFAPPETAGAIHSGSSAARAGAVVGGEWRAAYAPSAGVAADKPPADGPLSLLLPLPVGETEFASTRALGRWRPLTAVLRSREALAHPALNRACVTGVGFPAWSLPPMLLSAGD
jgi:hypothetical protein